MDGTAATGPSGRDGDEPAEAPGDGIDLLCGQHRRLEQLFRQFQAAAADREAATGIAAELVRELSVHGVVEEQVLYPVVRRALPGGPARADQALAGHKEMAAILESVQGEPVDRPDVQHAMRHVAERVAEHIADEERTLLPELRDALDAGQLARMGSAMAAAHRCAPDDAAAPPPGNVITGTASVLLERVRTAVRAVMRG